MTEPEGIIVLVIYNGGKIIAMAAMDVMDAIQRGEIDGEALRSLFVYFPAGANPRPWDMSYITTFTG